jgi:hypothetical protein
LATRAGAAYSAVITAVRQTSIRQSRKCRYTVIVVPFAAGSVALNVMSEFRMKRVER